MNPTIESSDKMAERSVSHNPDLSRCRWQVPVYVKVKFATNAVCPITAGVPFPAGLLQGHTEVKLSRFPDDSIPLQTEVLERWGDGSVKWLLLDFIASDLQEGTNCFTLSPVTPPPVDVKLNTNLRADGSATVDTGKLHFEIDGKHLRPFTQVKCGGRDMIDQLCSGIFLIDRRGQQRTGKVASSKWETIGAVRSTLLLCGRFPHCSSLRFELRLSFFVGTGLVRAQFTIHNPNRARHRGGLWDLGDRGSIFFRDLTMKLSLAAKEPATILWTESLDQNEKAQRAQRVEIYQDSSGGENWNCHNHVNRFGKVPCKFKGFRVRQCDIDAVNTVERYGLRATPTIHLETTHGDLAIAVPEFWQQFPKGISAIDNEIVIELFPSSWSDLFELQGGEQKTHTIWLNFVERNNDSNFESLKWTHAPPVAAPDPKWCTRSRAIPRFISSDAALSMRLDQYLKGLVDGPCTLIARREQVDEFGWRNFGEIFADHEALFHSGENLLVSHYNNQFDSIHGGLIQFLRTGDISWWEVADPLARHVIDIDIYRTCQDRFAYNGGLFWHTDHYLDAATCTHRTYSSHNRPVSGDSYGGGPASEHNYTSGLLLYYLLSGNIQAKDAVLMLGEWVINMDDGRLNILGIVDAGPTGAASRGGTNRSTGNSINALLDCWRITKDQRYLLKAEELIRRVIDPHEDISQLNLLDIENQWSYTIFLASLIRYLEIKVEANQNDEMYAYGCGSLVNCARWMLQYEIPYFDQIEKMEYATEAWAAQEFRKANVLRLASAYTGKDLATAMMNRGNELADRAWYDLLRFDSRYVARAAAIVMNEGVIDQWLRVFETSAAPQTATECPKERRERFVPQKQRVFTQLKSPSGFLRLVLRAMNPISILSCLHARKIQRAFFRL